MCTGCVLRGQIVSIDKAPNGMWRTRWRDESGRQRSKSFKRKADASAFEAETKHAMRQGDFVSTVAGQITLYALADRWLDASPHLAAGTLVTYRRDLDRYILPSLGTLVVANVTDDVIQRYLATEMEKYAASSVHRHYRTLRTMFEWAIRRRMISSNPCANVHPPRVAASKVHYLTAEEVERLADVIAPRYRAFVLVAAYGGLRWGELIGLRRSAVDGQRLTITEQLVKRDNEWRREDTKTSSSRRTVLLPASIADDLKEHLATFSQEGDDGLVFVNQTGAPIGHSFRANVWAPACVRAGLAEKVYSPGRLPKIVGAPRIHDMRHTAVALAISTGAHPKAIQQRLGHSSITVTLNTYGHLLDGVGEEMAANLDALRQIK